MQWDCEQEKIPYVHVFGISENENEVLSLWVWPLLFYITVIFDNPSRDGWE